MQITASVFINDDASGLHHDYEKWLEEVCRRLHSAPHAPVSQCRPWGRLHNRTGEDAYPGCRDRNADAHLKRNATRKVAHHEPLSEATVVAVTNGQRRKRVLVKNIGE
jgi:thiamine phosphate synthase YjbQ (UPF0047 family)